MRRYPPLLAAPALLLLCLLLDNPATAGVVVTINKATQRMTVAIDGEARYSWPVSTGTKGYATPTGSFRPFRLEKEHYSREWDDAPMPHSFFTAAGHAIHGTSAVRRLGSPASHGCVRLAPANAAKLFDLVQSEGLGSTKIVVTGAEARRVAKRRTASVRRARIRQQPNYDSPRYVETYYQYPTTR
jgi:lipoprotein-anchoring transpeptidase ErfK/SrfK